MIAKCQLASHSILPEDMINDGWMFAEGDWTVTSPTCDRDCEFLSSRQGCLISTYNVPLFLVPKT
ncbi:MAG: hypothetical protein OXI86_21205, partial [Candidatus Poribacteria bacterium]|nr:hypothetical protein [Candidatus Poribacteria bacterium]